MTKWIMRAADPMEIDVDFDHFFTWDDDLKWYKGVYKDGFEQYVTDADLFDTKRALFEAVLDGRVFPQPMSENDKIFQLAVFDAHEKIAAARDILPE